MSEQKTGISWWQTLPGLLTGIAAVITAVGGVIAVIHQSGLFGKARPNPESIGREQSNAPQIASSGVIGSPKLDSQSGESEQVRAGHYVFKLLDASQEAYSTGKGGRPQKLALRVSIRVTDVMGMSDYVDRRTIRLSVDGAELMPENSINFSVYERQSVETEALFIVPADSSTIELLLGRPEDTVARLPLPVNMTARR